MEKSDLMSEAKDEIQKWLAIPGIAFFTFASSCHFISTQYYY